MTCELDIKNLNMDANVNGMRQHQAQQHWSSYEAFTHEIYSTINKNPLDYILVTERGLDYI